MPDPSAPHPKVDLKKTLADYRAPRGNFDVVDLPERNYLMVDGAGDPNTAPEYAAALQALYPVAYAVKFLSKQLGRDYVVPPLEGLWWADDMEAYTGSRDATQWQWTMMILVPEWVGAESVAEGIARVAAGSRRPGSPTCGSPRLRRDVACRRCIWARIPRRARCWLACTTSSFQRRACV